MLTNSVKKGDILEFLAEGNEREAYIIKNQEDKIVKIPKYLDGKRKQNKLEYTYYEYLKKKKISFKHIAKCYGYKEFDGRRGLVFENILNYDGSAAIELSSIIDNKILSFSELEFLLEDLRVYLEENNIIFVDVGLDNVLCKEEKPKVYSLVIIDGLGARRPGFKLWIYMHLPFYAQRKIKVQWKKFISNVKNRYKD